MQNVVNMMRMPCTAVQSRAAITTLPLVKAVQTTAAHATGATGTTGACMFWTIGDLLGAEVASCEEY